MRTLTQQKSVSFYPNRNYDIESAHRPKRANRSSQKEIIGADKTSRTNTGLSHSFNRISVYANKPLSIQPKLTINTPGDEYEKEADAMADKVMRMPINDQPLFKPSPLSISRLQRKCAHCEEEEKLQRKESSPQSAEASSATSSYIGSLSSKGSPLPKSTRSFFEPRFGHDFSNVKVHHDSDAAKSSQAVNALAYTIGNNIVFNQGQFSPESESGKKLLAHELVHVVQQNGTTFSGATLGIDEDQRRSHESTDNRANPSSLVKIKNISAEHKPYSFSGSNVSSTNIAGNKPGLSSSNGSSFIQRSFLSGLLDVVLFVPRLFGLETFPIEDLRDYLKELQQKKGPSGSLFSDNKARACVSREQELGPYDIQTKTWLIQDMLDGYTSSSDENAIITLLRRSPKDLQQIVSAIGRERLWSKFSGENRRIIEAMTLTAADAGDSLISRLRNLSPGELQQYAANTTDPAVQESIRRATALAHITAPVPATASITPSGNANLTMNGIDVTFLPDGIDPSLGDHAMTYSKFTFDSSMPDFGPTTPQNANTPVANVGQVKINLKIWTNYPSEESKRNSSGYGAGTRPGDENTLQFHEKTHGEAWISFLGNNPPPLFQGTNGMLLSEYNSAVTAWKTAIHTYVDRAHMFALKAGDCVGKLPTDEQYAGTGFTAAICHTR